MPILHSIWTVSTLFSGITAATIAKVIDRKNSIISHNVSLVSQMYFVLKLLIYAQIRAVVLSSTC